MSVVATIPGTQSGGGGLGDAWNNLPFVAKMGIIGGGIGLAYFLYTRSQQGPSSSSNTGGNISATDSYGLPNTAVMLGSLQQEMLQLSGDTGAGFNTVSNQMTSDTQTLQDQITGSTETLGNQLTIMSGSIGQSFTDLQSNLITNQDANTASLMNAIAASTSTITADMQDRADALSQLISGNAQAQAAAMTSMQNSINQGLTAIQAQQNAEAAAIGALGNNVSSSQSALITQINSLQSSDINLSNQIQSIQTKAAGLLPGQFVKWWAGNNWGIGMVNTDGTIHGFQNMNQYIQAGGISANNGTIVPSDVLAGYTTIATSMLGSTFQSNPMPSFDWSSMSGRILYSSTDGSYYTVQNNNVYKTSSAYATQNSGSMGVIDTSMSLRGLSAGQIG